jgi:hypothetical protein
VNRGTSASPEIASQLELIKCTTLRGAAAVTACNALLAKGETSTEIQRALDEALGKRVASDQDPRHNQQRVGLKPADAIRTSRSIRGTAPKHNPEVTQKLGKFHALIIGNDAYQYFPSLETATADANAVTELLQTAYGFHTRVLLNADRHRILSELARLRASLKKEDNLLIYYAGHGYLDKDTQRGYWLPVDAERSNPANWVSNSDLNDMLLTIPAKRVLIVADSCYAGSLTPRATGAPYPSPRLTVTNNPEQRTRAVLTSGGLEPVLDTGHQGHSVFARVFLAKLRGNYDMLTTADLFPGVRREVQQWSEQTPQFAFLDNAGHTGGDFVFARLRSATQPRAPRPRLSAFK